MSAKTPHIHAAVIKAWADGAQIQYRKDYSSDWAGIDKPSWLPDYQYRVKPEPKPDIVHSYHYYLGQGTVFRITIPIEGIDHNVKFTFDGETHQLKSVELIK